MISRWVLGMSILGLAALAWGQSGGITGRVVDAATQAPLVGANVIV